MFLFLSFKFFERGKMSLESIGNAAIFQDQHSVQVLTRPLLLVLILSLAFMIMMFMALKL